MNIRIELEQLINRLSDDGRESMVKSSLIVILASFIEGMEMDVMRILAKFANERAGTNKVLN